MAPGRAPALASAAQHVTHRFDARSASPYTDQMTETATAHAPDRNQHVAHGEPALLVITDAAAHKVGELIAGEGNPKLMLRVFVQGGGCSGLQYGFEFDEVLQEGDTCIENQGVKLLVDPMSFQYLGGAEIDYREGLDGAQFVIRNPNAQTTCGCGSSFSA